MHLWSLNGLRLDQYASKCYTVIPSQRYNADEEDGQNCEGLSGRSSPTARLHVMTEEKLGDRLAGAKLMIIDALAKARQIDAEQAERLLDELILLPAMMALIEENAALKRELGLRFGSRPGGLCDHGV